MNYTVQLSGSVVQAFNSSGGIVYSGTDFATVMNSLHTLLKTGDTILIKNGVYPVTKEILNTNKNGIHYLGESLNAILQATPGNTVRIFCLDEGGMHTGPTDCVVDGLTFDSNFNTYISPSVGISGVRNTVQNCQFLNAKQYNLATWCATNFKIMNNTFNISQYAISTMGQASLYSTGGEIAYNTIKDCSDVGIKLKWTKNTSVHDNNIDTAYVTQPNNLAFTPSGIRYYHADGPTNDITVSHNVIYDSKPTSPQHTAGVFVDKDARKLSTGQVISENQITGCYYGVYNNWNNVQIKNNTFTSCKVPIQDNGAGTVKTGNIIQDAPTPPIKFTLTVQPPFGSGSSPPAVGAYQYDQGQVVSLMAVPSAGWLFNNWLVDGQTSLLQNPISITMSANHTAKVIFIEEPIPPPMEPCQEYIDQIAVLDAQIVKQNTKISALSAQITELNTQIDDLNSQITKLTGQIDILQTKNSLLQSKIEKAIQDLS